MHELDRGQFSRAGHQVIGERADQRLALLVVGNLLVERGADALHDTAADLSFDNHRVDHRAAILGDGEIEELGIDPARISVRHGDTESTAFGFGTFASRSMVMSGGAVARASRMLRDKLCRIGAHLLQCDVAETRCAGGLV